MYNGLTVPILLLKHNGEKYSPVSSVMPGYGPFLEMDAAIAELTSEFRGIENVPVGYTFCLIENDKPVEYWFTEAGNPESIEKKVIVSSGGSSPNEVWEKSGLGYKIKNSTNNVEEGNYAVATGLQNKASGVQTFVSGNNNKVTGNFAAGFGNGNKASGESSFASGMNTEAQGTNSHTEGDDTKAIGESSHSEGVSTKAFGKYSHSEGQSSVAKGNASHSEGSGFVDEDGTFGHAEGKDSQVTGYAGHAEGYETNALGSQSHAEGFRTTASGTSSHAEGNEETEASGDYSHAEGNGCKAIGESSHAEGLGTKTMNEGEHACGKYNKTKQGQLYSIGFGVDDNTRKNAVEVTENGEVYVKGIGYFTGENGENRYSLVEAITQLARDTVVEIGLESTFDDLQAVDGELRSIGGVDIISRIASVMQQLPAFNILAIQYPPIVIVDGNWDKKVFYLQSWHSNVGRPNTPTSFYYLSQEVSNNWWLEFDSNNSVQLQKV